VSRGAVRTVGSVAGESLPLIGIPVVVGVAGWELYDACQMMKDMQALGAVFEVEGAEELESEARMVCGLKVPTVEEVRAQIAINPRAAWAKAAALGELDLPDVDVDWASYGRAVGGWFGSVKGWFGGWFAK